MPCNARPEALDFFTFCTLTTRVLYRIRGLGFMVCTESAEPPVPVRLGNGVVRFSRYIGLRDVTGLVCEGFGDVEFIYYPCCLSRPASN